MKLISIALMIMGATLIIPHLGIAPFFGIIAMIVSVGLWAMDE